MNALSRPAIASPRRMAVWGFYYGLIFALVGTLVECAHNGQISFQGAWQAQMTTPLLWIIDLVPIVMASAGFFITLPPLHYRASRDSHLMAVLIIFLTTLPFGLLLYSLQQKYLADRYFDEINQIGRLRTEVLWVDSVTRQKVPVNWRMVVNKMSATRESMREAYPVEIGAGDAAWQQFKSSLNERGVVDWNTTTGVRKSIARLSDAVVATGRDQSRRTERWMLLGVLSMAFLMLLAFGILRRLRQAEIALHDTQERFDSFMNNSPAVAFIKDAQGRYTYLNEPFERHFEAQKAQWLGKTDDDLWPPELAAPMREQDRLVLRRGQAISKEHMAFASAGQPRYWLTFRFPLKDSGGNLMVAGLALEITERKRAEQKIAEQSRQLAEANGKYAEAIEQLALANSQLETLAITDGLTGLKNRRAFNERLDEEFKRVRRHGAPLSLLLLDVDKFKSYNDTFGHPAGDEVLKAVAMLLSHTARSIDFVARYGGEEFAVILPNTNREGALILAERFRHSIESAPWAMREITASIGVCTYAPIALDDHPALMPNATKQELIDAADHSLYSSKENGRNRVTHANPVEEALPEA